MALLVNYEGTYLPPQKLWYLVDGVWAEVKQIFENNSQNELTILDQERIKQDQVVSALQTKVIELSAKLSGTNLSIPKETDPVKIEALKKEIDLINLQLNVAKTEQVVMTKSLFEQKAQMEYIKLIGQGELALQKITAMVTNPSEWNCIRIAPQSTLDERLEITIQHGLQDDSRIFNYGQVYYRLYKLNSTDQNDSLTYLKEEFKRRMSKDAYSKGIEQTNYILTTDTIQNVYMEVNQFVNSGAKRIEDYLANIKEQQKFILDAIQSAKDSMILLEEAAKDGYLKLNDNGQILTNSTLTNLQVPLGEKLLAYQNVDSFAQLISTVDLIDITNGIKTVEDFPGITKLNKDSTALAEKIEAITQFQAVNTKIQNDLVTGKISFDLNNIYVEKTALDTSKELFWSTPLGNSTVSNSGGVLNYANTYTSGGTYKFKSDELSGLSTTYIAIIQALLANTKEGDVGVTIGYSKDVKIIQSVYANTINLAKDSIDVESTTTSSSIISAMQTNTKTLESLDVSFGVSDTDLNLVQAIEINTFDGEVLNSFTKVNEINQPHPAIQAVMANTTIEPEQFVTASVLPPPKLVTLLVSNTIDYPIMDLTKFGVEPYLYQNSIRQLNKEDIYNSSFNVSVDKIETRNTFIASFVSMEQTNEIQLVSCKAPVIELGEKPAILNISQSFIDEASFNNIITFEKPERDLTMSLINVRHDMLDSDSKLVYYNCYQDYIYEAPLSGFTQDLNIYAQSSSGTTEENITLVSPSYNPNLSYDSFSNNNSGWSLPNDTITLPNMENIYGIHFPTYELVSGTDNMAYNPLHPTISKSYDFGIDNANTEIEIKFNFYKANIGTDIYGEFSTTTWYYRYYDGIAVRNINYTNLFININNQISTINVGTLNNNIDTIISRKNGTKAKLLEKVPMKIKAKTDSTGKLNFGLGLEMIMNNFWYFETSFAFGVFTIGEVKINKLTSDFRNDAYSPLLLDTTKTINNIELTKDTNLFISSQTGLAPEEIEVEYINAINTEAPKFSALTKSNLFDSNKPELDLLNVIKIENPIMSAQVKTNTTDLNKVEFKEFINAIHTENMHPITQTLINKLIVQEQELLNKEKFEIVSIASQINPEKIFE